MHAVATHLLGDHLSRLSRSRDRWDGDGPRPGEASPSFIDRHNDEWVTASGPVSPRVLVDLLERAADDIAGSWRSVDMERPGEPVTWAGSDAAPTWLDCARDYTEWWVHHRPIRAAVGAPLLRDPSFMRPVIHTFAVALAKTLDEHAAVPDGAKVHLEIEGPSGGAWWCSREAQRWETARDRARVTGESPLIDATLQVLAIIR